MGIFDELQELNRQADEELHKREKWIADKAQIAFSAICQEIAKKISASNGSKRCIEGRIPRFLSIPWNTNPSAQGEPVYATVTYSYSHENQESFWTGKNKHKSDYSLSIRSTEAWYVFLTALKKHIDSEKGLSCRVYFDFHSYPTAGRDFLLWSSENQPHPFEIHPCGDKYKFVISDFEQWADYSYFRYETTTKKKFLGSKTEGKLISGNGMYSLCIEYTYYMS